MRRLPKGDEEARRPEHVTKAPNPPAAGTTVVIGPCHNAAMTSPTSHFQLHSPSIPTPTQSDSSQPALLTLTDHQSVPLACFELMAETEEKEIMSTNAQNLTNPSLEHRFFRFPRDPEARRS